jgi:hypothetical protein
MLDLVLELGSALVLRSEVFFVGIFRWGLTLGEEDPGVRVRVRNLLWLLGLRLGLVLELELGLSSIGLISNTTWGGERSFSIDWDIFFWLFESVIDSAWVSHTVFLGGVL